LSNFHNKTTSILVENGYTGEINLTLSFKYSKKIKLYQYSNVNFLELIESIA